MTRFVLLERALELVYGTFQIRRVLLMVLVVLSVAFGPFLRVVHSLLPASVFLATLYIYAGTISITGFFMYGAFKSSLKTLLGSLFLWWRYRARGFTSEQYRYYGVAQILNEMGIRKPVKIFVTDNPWVNGAYTNPLVSKVFIPASWLLKHPRQDLRGIIGHELGHIKTKGKFGKDVAIGMSLVVGSTLLVGMYSIMLVTEVFEMALVFLVLTAISWRNERRADWEGALVTGPEGLISVFEQLKGKRDEGNETHPSMGDRITRLLPLLDLAPLEGRS